MIVLVQIWWEDCQPFQPLRSAFLESLQDCSRVHPAENISQSRSLRRAQALWSCQLECGRFWQLGQLKALQALGEISQSLGPSPLERKVSPEALFGQP